MFLVSIYTHNIPCLIGSDGQHTTAIGMNDHTYYALKMNMTNIAVVQ